MRLQILIFPQILLQVCGTQLMKSFMEIGKSRAPTQGWSYNTATNTFFKDTSILLLLHTEFCKIILILSIYTNINH